MTKGRIFLLFSAGIIAGGAVVAVVMNQFYNQPEPENKTAPKVEKVNETEEIKAKYVPLDSTGNYLDKKLAIRIKGDTSSDYYRNIEENSVVFDSLKSSNSNTEVSINRDQMIESVKAHIYYFESSKVSAEDSLLNKLNSIKPANRPTSIDVEIWESPIHYKGYKMGKSKLVVYGIDPDAEILLYDLNDYVLLQSGTNYYKLERTQEFKNLRKFTDQAVISRLKK